MTHRNPKIIGALAASAAALALTPAAASADFSVTGATATEGENLTFAIEADCENGVWPCVDERFSFSVASGSARVEGDLPASSGSVLLSSTPWGHNRRVIQIPTTDDFVDEARSETVTFRVSHKGKFGDATREATGIILDNDPEPQVDSVSAPATTSEGTGGQRSVPFTIRLQKASEQTVVRSYATADGSAKAGTDYVNTAGDLVFAPGETEKTVNVPIVTDSVEEPSETFSLNSGTASATVRILDDDVTPAPGNQNPGNQNPGNQNPGNQNPGNQVPNTNTNTGTQQSSAAAPQVIYVPSSTATAPAATKKATKKKAAAKKCRKGTVAKKGKNKKIRCVKKAKKRGSNSQR